MWSVYDLRGEARRLKMRIGNTYWRSFWQRALAYTDRGMVSLERKAFVNLTQSFNLIGGLTCFMTFRAVLLSTVDWIDIMYDANHAPRLTFVLISVIFLPFFFLPPACFFGASSSPKDMACTWAMTSSSWSKSFSQPCNHPSSAS